MFPDREGEEMKVTSFKAKANRKNAQNSTGPKTARGKAAVRHNSLKHAILARIAEDRKGDSPAHQHRPLGCVNNAKKEKRTQRLL